MCQKDNAYHVFYNTDARVFVESDTWQGELKIFPNPITQQENSPYTKMACKHFEFIDSLCCDLTKKIRETNPFAWPVGLFGSQENIKKYHNFMPFLKVHVNPEGERCVVVHLDGEEKIIPIIDIANKHFKMKAIIKIGAIKPHAKSPNRLVISLTVEELKLSTDLAKLSYNIQTPELRFAHKIDF